MTLLVSVYSKHLLELVINMSAYIVGLDADQAKQYQLVKVTTTSPYVPYKPVDRAYYKTLPTAPPRSNRHINGGSNTINDNNNNYSSFYGNYHTTKSAVPQKVCFKFLQFYPCVGRVNHSQREVYMLNR